ncbi:MAG: 4-hydroxy-tetrahydrodipicolinate reductase, partial [bacterium]|nr:4-hydroxy-tetrahydrodipicolinate reductase [bacterium]
MEIIIGGALGRMGRQVALAAQEAGADVVCGVDVAYTGQPADFPIVTDFAQVNLPADVLIDFSRPDALPELLQMAISRRMPVVLCATGYTDVELESIREAAQTIPILQSANMSLGVNVLTELVRMASRTLEGFDIEIVEKHHRMKADSPSGTALMLYDAAKREKGSSTEPVYGRYG